MGAELEVINDKGEIALSLDKPAVTLDPWATAKANASGNRTKISSRRYTHRWIVSGFGALDDDLIGFRTSTHYAALVKRSDNSLEVWSNSGSLWDDFEVGVFRKSTAVTGFPDGSPTLPDGYCELLSDQLFTVLSFGGGTSPSYYRKIYDSGWPNVSDIALFSTHPDLIYDLDQHGSRNARSTFSGRSRTGGVDWIIPMGMAATFVRMRYEESYYLYVYYRWKRYAALMRVDRSTSDDVDIRTIFHEFWRSSSGELYGAGVRRWDVTGYDAYHRIRWVHTPEIMVFRTFGSYK